jgi:phage replication initiation protein
VLVDWCEWTEKSRPVEEVCDDFPGEWVNLPHGALGYRGGRQHATGLRVLYDGAPGMGVHVAASGEVCRRLEHLGVVGDWPAFLATFRPDAGVITEGRRLTRLDVAVDETVGLVDVDRCEAELDAGHAVSRWRDSRLEPAPRSIAHPEQKRGRPTLYIGSRATSDAFCRIYDKADEQGSKGNDVAGHWHRVEVVTRDQRARDLGAHLAKHGLQSFSGVLRGYLDFKTPGSDSNRRRWATAEWWDQFLQGAAKTRITRAPKPAPTLEERIWHMEHNYGPTLAVMAEVYGIEELVRIAQRGKKRWRPLHRVLLAEARAS